MEEDEIDAVDLPLPSSLAPPEIRLPGMINARPEQTEQVEQEESE